MRFPCTDPGVAGREPMCEPLSLPPSPPPWPWRRPLSSLWSGPQFSNLNAWSDGEDELIGEA